jgi:hypothetical protein
VKAAEEKNKLRQQRGCAYCVLKQLDVRNSAGEPFECRGSEFLTHIPDVKTISKAYALQCVKGGVKSADLLKVAEAAVEAHTGFRVGPNPRGGGKGKRGAGVKAEATTGDK